MSKPPALVLRHRVSVRLTAVGAVILFAAGAWLLPGTWAESRIRGGVFAFALLYFLLQGVPDALHIVSYRLEVGRDYVKVRTLPWREWVVPFHNIKGFVEDLYNGSGMFHWEVLRFRFLSTESSAVPLTAMIPGWAAAINTVHQVIPWAVPHPDRLLARAAPKYRQLSGLAHLVPSPGQNMPEEWSWRKRVLARDWVLGFGLAFLVVVPAAVAASLSAVFFLGWREDVVRSLSPMATSAFGLLLGLELTRRFRRRRVDRSGGWATGYDDEKDPDVSDRASRFRRGR